MRIEFADDAMNSLMMVTQVWGPRATPLTEHEQRELEFPPNLRLANAPPHGSDWARAGWELGRVVAMETARRRKQDAGDNWTHEICDPGSDPWRLLHRDDENDPRD